MWTCQGTPGAAGPIAGGIIAIIFGLFWTGFAAPMNAPGIFPLFGLFFIAFAVFGMLRSTVKSNEYQSALRLHEKQRHEALRKIAEAKQAAKT